VNDLKLEISRGIQIKRNCFCKFLKKGNLNSVSQGGIVRMKRGLFRSLIFGVAAVVGVFLFAQTASAVSGRCDKCHTMHNSQDGAPFNIVSANDALLLNKCIGCHSHDVSTSPISDPARAPVVTYTAPPSGVGDARVTGDTYLAGGSFYWVETDGPEYGHNVQELNAPLDGMEGNPPGDTSSDYATTEPLSCNDRGNAGGYTGCHYGGGHHSNEGADYENDPVTTTEFVTGNDAGSSYRFLSGNTIGGENADWEWTFTRNDHNIYSASTDYDAEDVASLTGVCIRCHGDFHGAWFVGAGLGSGTGAGGAWYRHPTDLDITAVGINSEHAAYGSYDPTVPIADSSIPSDGTQVVTGADWNAYNSLEGSAGVNAEFNKISCVSCHRAHGSEYLDALRWSYGRMDAGGGAPGGNTLGCFKCHTAKD
jgi:hypothetical protein